MIAAFQGGRRLALLLVWMTAAVGTPLLLSRPPGAVPPVGALLDPLDGLYRTARRAAHPLEATVPLEALDRPVTVVRDDRGVPHIFAESDRDAVVAMGYVVAQDRLFQLDFTPRVAAGRLAEVFGPPSLEADRFLRRTGMEWGARKTLAVLQAEGGPEYDLVTWFAAGVNAYIDAVEERDLPFEFRLLGYRPDRFTPLHAVRLMQYFAYDLSYQTDAPSYGDLQARLGAAAYARLYPRHAPLSVPIIPDPGGGATTGRAAASRVGEGASMAGRTARGAEAPHPWAEGFVPGKGSNNWVVGGERSATGAPLLAGDMHLRLTLPSIWYEVHLVTPTMNTYGVTSPGAPLPIAAFNNFVAWTFTNTGADVIDHYALELDEAGLRYSYGDGYRGLEAVLDTLWVKDAEAVVDTLYYAHWGPVAFGEGGAVATRWAAHEPGHTLRALWEMNHARSVAEVEEALRFWGTPMQNVAQADVEGVIAIRSAGYLPLRRGGAGVGLLDGASDSSEWIGRAPFEDLPHAVNPAQGFLSSTNQEPADSTYPYYLGHDWRSIYRSIRIDTLLRGQPKHSVAAFKRYQADVHAVQRDLFVPLLDTLGGLSPRADTLRRFLAAWTGETGVDASEPLVLDVFLASLRRLAWDEPAFDGLKKPGEAVLYGLLRHDPGAVWLDVQATEDREDADDLLRLALEAAADTLAARYGWDRDAWRWGDHHRIEFRHLTQWSGLRALWRGPFEYPGFASTLSPAGARTTLHSASWRVVVDLSQSPPKGYGVYPGGQSGNPFSRFYDLHVPTYLAFEHYELLKPSTPEELDAARVSSRLTLTPAAPR